MAPASGARTIEGALVASASAPTAAGLPVSSRMSQPAAMTWSQVPPFEATLASQNRR